MMLMAWGSALDPNPCVACHNSHAAKTNYVLISDDAEGVIAADAVRWESSR